MERPRFGTVLRSSRMSTNVIDPLARGGGAASCPARPNATMTAGVWVDLDK
jgi:hypothetical protein